MKPPGNNPQVDLLWLGSASPGLDWPLGSTYFAAAGPEAVSRTLQSVLHQSTAGAWLFWDGSLGAPQPETVLRALQQPGDIWHAGLKLGLRSQPDTLGAVASTWMLHPDPDENLVATSWRVSLRACLVRAGVLRQVDFIRPGFDTLEGASLEWGHRCLSQGVIPRAVPWLVPPGISVSNFPLSTWDEMLFIACRYKRPWLYWSSLAYVLRHPAHLLLVLSNLKKINKVTFTRIDQLYSRKVKEQSGESALRPQVSIILPTRMRYEYLGKCLETLGRQTVPPTEIICVDQNPSDQRRPDMYQKFSDLPLQVIWQDTKGQSIARNAALHTARGEWLFFADDDSEYPPDTIAQHLELIHSTSSEGSSGLSLPPYAYTVPPEFRYPQVAYNFDTGNALVRRQAVLDAGGFDRHYDFGKGADVDLGTRLYLQGCLLMHNPAARRLHYKAESGGLREYGVWWSANRVGNLQPRPASTHTYWIMRYLDRSQWLQAVILSVLGSVVPRSAKSRLAVVLVVVGEIFHFPLTCIQIWKSWQQARTMVVQGPRLMGSEEKA